MRRLPALILALALSLSLAACGGGEAERETGLSAAQIADAVAAGQPDLDLDAMTGLQQGDEGFADYLERAYGLDAALLEDGAVGHSSGVSAAELTVLRFREAGDAEDARQALMDYVDARLNDFYGYAPAQAALLEEAAVLFRGRYAALLVLPDQEAARADFDRCFDGSLSADDFLPAADGEVELDGRGYVAFHPPNEYDMTPYDTSAILAAWQSGDPSGLSERDGAILAACEAALNALDTDGRTALEQELAVHDWMVLHGDYDWSHAGADALNPYGFLVDGRAICQGYATTFQLFMDLLGVECITVAGASHNSSQDHAWNMVRLDGDWYCVDVTWDDPGNGDQVNHGYFNVTSDFMRDTGHQWDYDAMPEATAPPPPLPAPRPSF